MQRPVQPKRPPIRLAIALVLGVMGSACATPGPRAPAVSPPPQALRGVPVGLAVGAKASDGQLIVGLNHGFTTSSLPTFKGQPGQILGELDFAIPIKMIKLPAGVTLDEAITTLKNHPAVALLAPNGNLTSMPRPADLAWGFASRPGPDDPLLPQEWGFADTVTDARVLWQRNVDASKVMVAVIDTGIDYTHPDLAGHVLAGYNFKDGTTDIMDRDGHGTHVAGIIGAQGNNHVGVAGVSWSAKLLAIKVMDGDGGTDYGAIAGIKYAVDVGAQVVNLSFSTSSTQRNPLFDLAVQYATDHGATVVAAAGNQHGPVTAPANAPGALAVSATSERGYEGLANFSNFGPEVFIAAPGENILSTYPQGGYKTLSGTSMATPFIAGAAAVLYAEHPDWRSDDVRHALELATDRLGMLGRNDQFGYGRIDFAKLP